MAGLLQKVYQTGLGRASGWYRGWMCSRLKPYGLQVEDLYDPLDCPVTAEALKRLTPTEANDRNRRILRAIDCSYKRKMLPESFQETFDPFAKPYLQKHIEAIEKEKAERLAVNKTYSDV